MFVSDIIQQSYIIIDLWHSIRSAVLIKGPYGVLVNRSILGDRNSICAMGTKSLCMMMSSNGNSFRVSGPLCGEFTGHRWIPLTKASKAELWFFSLICTLNEQSWDWWFETPSPSLWRHCNGDGVLMSCRCTSCGIPVIPRNWRVWSSKTIYIYIYIYIYILV